MTDSILNIKISCFASCTATTPEDVSLLAWLKSEKHRAKVEQIRSIQDEDLQKVIKKTLPAITPSGRFSHRDTDHLLEHSGFLVFDIDFADNRHIVNFDDLKQQISHIASVAYCGLSVRGRGFWGLIPVPASTPQEHKKRFEALSKDFQQFGIVLDKSGSDVCRLRIYSWDPDAYFNHCATLYTKIVQPKAERRSFNRPEASDTRAKVEAVIQRLKEGRIDITESYDSWLRVGAAFANEFGESGRGYFHTVSHFHADYSPVNVDRKFDSCLNDRISKIGIGTFFHIASDHGLTLAHETPAQPPAAPAAPVTEHKTTTPQEKSNKAIIDVWGVADLETFFNSRELPTGPIRLDQCTMILDLPKFIDAELTVVKAQNGKEAYRPYLERLKQLQIILS